MALRIKDNIDIKELEKFGFEHWKTVWKSDENMEDENEWSFTLKFTQIDEKIQVILINIKDKDRIIREYIDKENEMYCIVHETRLDVLYDLIQAGLVEKVK